MKICATIAIVFQILAGIMPARAQSGPPGFIRFDSLAGDGTNSFPVVLFYNSSWQLTTPEKSVVRREATVDLVNLRFSGAFRDYTKDDKLVAEGFYQNGVKNGFESTYFETGALKSTVRYDAGEFSIEELTDESGRQEVSNGSGKFKIDVYSFEHANQTTRLIEGTLTGEFHSGRRTGKWIYRDQDDRITDEEAYEDGTFVRRTTFIGTKVSVIRYQKPVFISLESLITESFTFDAESYPRLSVYFEKLRDYPGSFERTIAFPGGMNRLLLLLATKFQLKIKDTMLFKLSVDEAGRFSFSVLPGDLFDREFERLIQTYGLALLPAVKNGVAYSSTLLIPVSTSPEWIRFLGTATAEEMNDYLLDLNRDPVRQRSLQNEELAREAELQEKRKKARNAYRAKKTADHSQAGSVTLFYNEAWQLTRPERAVVRRIVGLNMVTMKFFGPYKDYSNDKLVRDGFYSRDGVKVGLETEYADNGSVKSVVELARDGFIIWELNGVDGRPIVQHGTGKFTIHYFQVDDWKRGSKINEGTLAGEFQFGKRVGTWTYRKRNGEVTDEEIYDRDVFVRRISITKAGKIEVDHQKPVLLSTSSLATESLDFDRKAFTHLNRYFEETLPQYPAVSDRLVTLKGGMAELMLFIAVDIRVPVPGEVIAKIKVDEHGNLKKIWLRPFLWDYDGVWNRRELMAELERIIEPNGRKFLPAVRSGKPCEMYMRIKVSNDPRWIEFLETAPDEQIDDYLVAINEY